MRAIADRPLGGAATSPASMLIIAIAFLGGVVLVVIGTLGYGRLLLTGPVLGGAALVGIVNWRWSVIGVVAYLPFSGLPILFTYPNTSVAVLAKDILFVAPAYLGVIVAITLRRQSILYRGAPLFLMVAFATWAIVHALNPGLPNRLVGAIGLKVWLWYMPLLFMGYHLLQDRRDLKRLLPVLVLTGLIPMIVGILQAAAIYSGYKDEVYAWYGAAARAATQGGNGTGFADGVRLYRIPSLFSQMAQYYVFCTVMISITYAWWRGSERSGPLPPIAFIISVLATLLTGSRAAFLWVPMAVVGLLFLDRRLRGRGLAITVVPIVMMVGAVALIGTSVTTVGNLVLPYALDSFDWVFVAGIRDGLDRSWFGTGTGMDTGAARYAFVGGSSTGGIALQFGVGGQESWYAKALIELGLPGLALIIAILGLLTVRAFRHHFELRDPRLRAMSAGIIVLLLWTLVNSLKSQFLDLDPLNVYFWLLMGIHERLPSLDTVEPQPSLRPPAAPPSFAPLEARRGD